MAYKCMYIPNDDTQNTPFCKLKLVFETFKHPLNKPAYQNSVKAPKVVKPTKNNVNVKFLGLL